MVIRDVPSIGENDVLLKMLAVGICGSDLKYWGYGQCGMFKLDGQPMVIGHEGAGKVVQVGNKVTNLKIGDRVAIEPGIPCKDCLICKSGSYNLCQQMRFCATPPIDGLLCNFFPHPQDFCFKLPDNVSDEEGALVEPLAVAVYACRRGGVAIGSKVLVCGAGPVGILTMWVAKNMGASTVEMTDIDEFRLMTAKHFGADTVVNVSNLSDDATIKLMELKGIYPDVTMECSGSDFSMRLGIHVTQPGGCIVQVGRGSPSPQIPLNLAATKQVDIRGVFRYANCYPAALELIARGKLPHLSELITHRFSFLSSQQAFKTAMDKQSQAIKVMIQF